MASRSSSEAFSDLSNRMERYRYLDDVGSLLSWDQQVMMPNGGTPARSRQRGTLDRAKHELVAADEMGDLLGELQEADLDPDEQAVVREARRLHERAAPVDDDLVAELREAISDAFPVWTEAKEADDFDAFAPALEEVLELKREYAAQIDPDADPYAVLFADHEPYLPLDRAAAVLEELRDALVPMIDDIHDARPDLATDAFATEVDAKTQESISREVLDLLGYDWDRGRLDTSAHPFSTGTQFDARITTRYDESDLLDGLLSTIHEFGHAWYTLGLPTDAYGSPLGASMAKTVHESQSRLWENHVGRTRPFWEHVLSRAAAYVPALESVTPQEAYEATNQVFPDNPIRVEADELTYHLHILVRFEIERDLVRGDLAVEEVPAVWNDTYEEYLGIRPETDAEGCLQDVHWAHGAFGYFPTYTLGSMLAAQLDDAMRAAVGDVDDRIREGDVQPITDWLREHVHRHGQRFTTPELVERTTGGELSAGPFLAYAREKYGDLYGI